MALTHKALLTTLSNFVAFSKITNKALYFMTDDSHELYLIFSKILKDVARFAVCCSCDWRFKG